MLVTREMSTFSGGSFNTADFSSVLGLENKDSCWLPRLLVVAGNSGGVKLLAKNPKKARIFENSGCF